MLSHTVRLVALTVVAVLEVVFVGVVVVEKVLHLVGGMFHLDGNKYCLEIQEVLKSL